MLLLEIELCICYVNAVDSIEQRDTTVIDNFAMISDHDQRRKETKCGMFV